MSLVLKLLNKENDVRSGKSQKLKFITNNGLKQVFVSTPLIVDIKENIQQKGISFILHSRKCRNYYFFYLLFKKTKNKIKKKIK